MSAKHRNSDEGQRDFVRPDVSNEAAAFLDPNAEVEPIAFTKVAPDLLKSIRAKYPEYRFRWVRGDQTRVANMQQRGWRLPQDVGVRLTKEQAESMGNEMVLMMLHPKHYRMRCEQLEARNRQKEKTSFADPKAAIGETGFALDQHGVKRQEVEFKHGKSGT